MLHVYETEKTVPARILLCDRKDYQQGAGTAENKNPISRS
jgi:hypothetical protein